MKELLLHLQLLGFTQYEARVYLSLLEHYPVTGYELSKQSGVPASKIYQVLNRLKERDIVLVLDEEPVRYVPHPPEEVLAHLRQRYLDSLNYLQTELEQLYRRSSATSQYIWNVGGREAILQKVLQFVTEAREEIFLSLWQAEYEPLQEAIQAAHQRGVEVHLVYYGRESLPLPRVYPHGREEEILRRRQSRRLALAVDESRMLIANFPLNGRATAAWTENTGLVLLTKDYITHDIYTIQMMHEFGERAREIMNNLSERRKK